LAIGANFVGDWAQQSCGIRVKHPANLDKFDDVHSELPTFILGYEGLRPLQPRSQLILGQASFLASGDHRLTKRMLGVGYRRPSGSRSFHRLIANSPACVGVNVKQYV
jgi:hypothetical protein